MDYCTEFVLLDCKFTLAAFWILFVGLWAMKSLLLRRGRHYARDRRIAHKNSHFKGISYAVFAAQVTLPILTLYSTASALLLFHTNEKAKIFGLACVFVGLGLYLWAQSHLGRNYSPCFDSHVPFEIVMTGPYKYIRHPGWLSKFIVAVGTLVFSGSYWLVIPLIWLTIELKRTVIAEEAYLSKAFPDYEEYRTRTKRIIPFVF